jgi:hypothetical protein
MFSVWTIYRSKGSIVSIVTNHGLGGLRFDSRHGQVVFSSPKTFSWIWGPFNWCKGYFPQVHSSWSMRLTCHLHLALIWVNMSGFTHLLHPYAFMVCVGRSLPLHEMFNLSATKQVCWRSNAADLYLSVSRFRPQPQHQLCADCSFVVFLNSSRQMPG